MKKNIEQQLTELGPARLAKALIDLSERSNLVHDYVENLVSTSEEKIEYFKKEIADIKTSKRYISWNENQAYADELEMLLMDLKEGIDDPLTGINLIMDFYTSDENIFEHCDDSGGEVGYLFQFTARDIFIYFASNYSEKKKIADMLIKLNQVNHYGVRNSLIDSCIEFLSEKNLRYMVSEFHKLADKEKDKFDQRHYYVNIESLAKQLKDPDLYLKTRIKSRGELSTEDYIEISKIYLDRDDIETAHSWLQKLPEDEIENSYECKKLLMEIYKKQGNSDKLAKMLHENLRACYSINNLNALLEEIGYDQKDKIIEEESALILKKEELRISDAEFLISIGKIDEAEKYIIQRASQLHGYSYGSMLPIAELMDLHNRHLVAALLYRSLLISILNRGYTKAYHHGVSYLKKLDQLAIKISNWENFDNHEAFKDEIVKEHGRKRSFWSKI